MSRRHSSDAPPADGRHIVDVLLAERAPRLLSSPLWPLLGPLRNAFFGYGSAKAMADAIAPLSGNEALAHVSDLLRLQVTAQGLERIPHTGACIFVANHPTGIADGIAVYDVLRQRRSDLQFFANADAHRICPRFGDVLVPVPWPASKRTLKATRHTLRLARDSLEAQRALVIFAAGVMSRHIDGRLQDPPWEHSAVALARRHHVPIVPVNVAGPYSFLFHLFGRISQQLRDITLFHELMNKRKGRYSLIFGEPVDALAVTETSEALTLRLKRYVEQVLPDAPHAPFSATLTEYREGISS